MEERDIFWIKEVIENGDVEFNEGVGASDNPIIFRFEDNYIVQADNCLYMDDSLEISKIDKENALEEIKDACNKLMQDSGNDVVWLDRYLGLEARMLIDCVVIHKNVYTIEADEYYIDYNGGFSRAFHVLMNALANMDK